MRVPLILLASLLSFQAASAHEFSALLKAKKYGEAEKAATARLAADPNNADALTTKAHLILIEGKESRLDEGIKLTEQCVAAHPKHSECYEMRGNVMGTKAQKAGVLSAMGYIGTIRDSFKRAVELDPNNFGARTSLLQFYLQAPSMVGGGMGKAKDFAAETRKVNAAAGALLQATIELSEKEYDRAAATALSVDASGNDTLASQQRSVMTSVGHAMINEKKYAEAEKIFREEIKRYAESPQGYFGLGKTLQESGKAKDALPWLEKANSVEASAAAFYRIGKSWQALGDKTKAIGAYERSLSFKPELTKVARADAESQLKSLR
jgi:tetratricopeptide (TPR) repeat protein